ncbi:hypothetical protein KY290_007870 [Solanum tuberosum]|uniref:Reverse transcriptase domain-containing protein n=1 Tax=Solanum tuberosum TaxID=4113 RepID=A0ABQ7W8S0_SOLTU|nr:hypothetical protein KY290_007870 [Solanum tuberosum]
MVIMKPTMRTSQIPSPEDREILNPQITHNPMTQQTSFMVWNTRGVNNENFKRNFRELICNHNPCFVALLETKMDDHFNLKNEFNFDDYLRKDDQELHAMIQGCKYTWSNHRRGMKDLILERLDRAFANNDWLVKYPNAQVTHLPKTHSDHNLLLISLFKPNSGNLSKPFRLEKFWLEHPDFINLVERCWINNDLISAISLCRNEAHIWSRETFGNIFKKKRTILARLGGIQNSLSYPSSCFLHNLRSTLLKDYSNILKLEEDYWKLRSRINWIRDGDANTRFYHLSVINRRRRNNIYFFKDDNDNWITSHKKIVEHAFSYYNLCFTTDHSTTYWKDIHNSTPRFHKLDLSPLDRPLADFEVVQALFPFKTLKAPRSDGFHPQFFQQHWHSVKNTVLKPCHEIFNTQKIPTDLNQTFLCLSPKFKNANHLKNFRPIGLCNTMYKIVTKIIANHIKPFLNELISPHQTSFLNGRRACDNDILVQELLTHINKLKAKKAASC